MLMIRRTDPLTIDGKVDAEFFASHAYEAEQKCLLRYLEIEGFGEETESFVIDFKCRRWQIFASKTNK